MGHPDESNAWDLYRQGISFRSELDAALLNIVCLFELRCGLKFSHRSYSYQYLRAVHANAAPNRYPRVGNSDYTVGGWWGS